MNIEQFTAYQLDLFGKIQQITKTKGLEYMAGSEDRFANFKRSASRLRTSPLAIASVYLDKHLDAIGSFILTERVYSSESIEGRFLDAIAYLMLMAGIAKEMQEKQRPGTGKTTLLRQKLQTEAAGQIGTDPLSQLRQAANLYDFKD